ncbi:lipopolysaccharide-induced tumor necrosis factor-alpha factor-like protein [Leptotrombidium deliense]|uniref:Lipopolysaccharide-induced tumor necrosis factor-alpha factor-like protein n=1 Tax=Leptotrombidium deliense TaxID=299467 RepID=A0A443S5I8_9ACAR|nr:lipopolysaccharide-induced tumor necrosis factor-alpha factor-like protein [Leptotrombidium deliense]
MSEKEFLYNNPPPPPYNAAVAGSGPYPAEVDTQKYAQPSGPPPGFTNQVVVTGVRFGPFPIKVPCNHCQQEVVTTTTPVTGGITWLLAGIMCLSGLFCGCCLLPFCVEACQDIEHKCPNCRSTLGIYKRMGKNLFGPKRYGDK